MNGKQWQSLAEEGEDPGDPRCQEELRKELVKKKPRMH